MSTFDQLTAATPEASPLSVVINAYQSGKMAPEDAAQFESAVKAGQIFLPKGINLKTAPQAPASAVLPGPVLAAYNSGRMESTDAAALERALAAGEVSLPQGMSLSKPSGNDIGMAAVKNALGEVAGVGENLYAMGAEPVRQLAGVAQGVFNTGRQFVTGQEVKTPLQNSQEYLAGIAPITPKTTQGQAIAQSIGQTMEEAKIPPYVPMVGPASTMAGTARTLSKAAGEVPIAENVANTLKTASAPIRETVAPVARAAEAAPIKPQVSVPKFEDHVANYEQSLPIDNYTQKQQIKSIKDDIEKSWQSGNPDEYARVYGPDEIRKIIKNENKNNSLIDAEGDYTDAGWARANQLEDQLSTKFANELVGAAKQETADYRLPDHAANLLNSYLDKAGLSSGAIGGSGKSSSKYIALKDGRTIRVSDHELPPEYQQASIDLILPRDSQQALALIKSTAEDLIPPKNKAASLDAAIQTANSKAGQIGKQLRFDPENPVLQQQFEQAAAEYDALLSQKTAPTGVPSAQPSAGPAGAAYKPYGPDNPRPANGDVPKPYLASDNPAQQVKPQSIEELGQTTRKAALGGFGAKKAEATLAEQVAPNPDLIAAAQRTGQTENVTPAALSTNQAYRQLEALVTSQTGSEAGAINNAKFMKFADTADKIVKDIGGTSDLSTLSVGIAEKMKASIDGLKNEAGKIYDSIDKAIPKPTPIVADNLVALVKKSADDLGGVDNLSAGEKRILAQLSSDAKPTYGLLDQIRKDIGAAKRGASDAFGSADQRQLGALETALREDQKISATKAGVGQEFEKAQAIARQYKAIQDDMKVIYGDKLDKSLAPLLTTSIQKLGAGAKVDTSAFIKLLKATPENMRQELVASGLSQFFQKNTAGGQMSFANYAKWFESLQANKQAYTSIMANLPPATVRALKDTADLSRGIAMARGEFLATGKAINPKVLEAADGLAAKLFETVRAGGIRMVAAEAASSLSGAPGLGTVLTSRMERTKPAGTKLADAVIASPEFMATVLKAGTKAQKPAIVKLVVSKPFTAYAREIQLPKEIGQREKWILQAMQQNQNNGKKP